MKKTRRNAKKRVTFRFHAEPGKKVFIDSVIVVE